MLRTLLIVVPFSLSLAACEPKEAKLVCPQLKQYSSMTQAAMAKEFEEVKQKYPAVTQLVADYKQLRDVIRACQKGARK